MYSIKKGSLPPRHEQFICNALPILMQDSRIIGITLWGSYASNTMDDFSDLDFGWIVMDESVESLMKDRFALAQQVGDAVAMFSGEHVKEPRLLICLYGPELLHVDFKIFTPQTLRARVEEPTLLWEKEDTVSQILSSSHVQPPTPSAQWIEDRFWVWIHYLATKAARGELLETVGGISWLRSLVHGPMISALHGEFPDGMRRIEFVSNAEELRLLQPTIPVSLDRESCVNALIASVALYRVLRESWSREPVVLNTRAESLVEDYLKSIQYH